jgi:hypothetical protein
MFFSQHTNPDLSDYIPLNFSRPVLAWSLQRTVIISAFTLTPYLFITVSTETYQYFAALSVA